MPAKIHCAYTEPINPEGATPVLSRDQIWRGLQRKIRKAQDFVPVITDCEVESEKGNEVTRIAHFGPMNGNPARKVREVCKSYYPTRVDFWQPSGTVITNTISDGPGLDGTDLHMTYTFEWDVEEEEGSAKYQELVKSYTTGAKAAVHMSIEAMRKMAAAGELDG